MSDKRVDFKNLEKYYQDVVDRTGTRRVELTECPSTCPKFAERDDCTPDTCVVLQDILDRDELVLTAYDAALKGKSPDEMEEELPKRDMGLKGNVYQQSRRFLMHDIQYTFKGDKFRIYRIGYNFQELRRKQRGALVVIADDMELHYKPKMPTTGLIRLILMNDIPNTRVSVYGLRGKTQKLLVSVEFRWEYAEHWEHHGFPFIVRLPSGKRRVCVRNCYECRHEVSKELYDYCRAEGLRASRQCPGCKSSDAAMQHAKKWYNNIYIPSLGLSDEIFTFREMRFRRRTIYKPKGERWL